MSRRMTQMPLFSADQEASRRLREAYDLLLADYEAALARLDQAKGAYRLLREERDQALKERDQARAEEHYWQKRWEAEQRRTRSWRREWEHEWVRRTTTPTPAPTLEPTLKKLLTLAHPDKWARGQPATELAHELAVTINRLREGQP